MKDFNSYIRDKRSPVPLNDTVSKVMSAIRAKNTKPELTLRRELWHSGVRGYRLHWKKIPGRPDMVFLRHKLAIFVNGCFWHRCPSCSKRLPKSNTDFWLNKFEKNTERDKKRVDELENQGWKVVTLWECELKKDINQAILEVQERIVRGRSN